MARRILSLQQGVDAVQESDSGEDLSDDKSSHDDNLSVVQDLNNEESEISNRNSSSDYDLPPEQRRNMAVKLNVQ